MLERVGECVSGMMRMWAGQSRWGKVVALLRGPLAVVR